MNFDEYWNALVERDDRGEPLSGVEERFFRLSCIYGETMVDGIEAYFERRWGDMPADMEALRGAGFPDIASEFEAVRRLVFGESEPEQEVVEERISRLLDEAEEDRPILAEIEKAYRRLIPRLEALADYKYQLGLEQGLYVEDGV